MLVNTATHLIATPLIASEPVLMGGLVQRHTGGHLVHRPSARVRPWKQGRDSDQCLQAARCSRRGRDIEVAQPLFEALRDLDGPTISLQLVT
jgi:hypothetical protein